MARTSKIGKQKGKHQKKTRARKSVRKPEMAARIDPRQVKALGNNEDQLATRDSAGRDDTGPSTGESAGRDQKTQAMHGAGGEPTDERPSDRLAAQVYYDAAGLGWRTFQTLIVLSFQNWRMWQDTWTGVMRSNR